MSTPDPREGASTVLGCPLCGAPIRVTDDRCAECNMTLAGVGARPGPFTRQALWFWAAGLLVIYLVVLAIVAVAR
jgi:hypothetical protein